MQWNPLQKLNLKRRLMKEKKMTDAGVTLKSKQKASVPNPLDSQVGGSHYNRYPMQPIEYAMANRLNYCQANAIKYITRYRDKGGREDLEKAIHNIQILIKLEYGD